jgi:SAM-dependent methyltransferase
MSKVFWRFCLSAAATVLLAGCATSGSASSRASAEQPGRQDALRMIEASRGTLAPVYGPLAEHIVTAFHLGEKTGIGIDVGSGPGTLIIELCERTPMHWINADINPHFFPHFYADAEKRGFGHRVSAVFADAQALPFRDNFADIIVSRGSFHLWQDKAKAFAEIYRVLKPGTVAYIGRGFSENLPLETAKKIRAGQGGGPKYDVNETADQLQQIVNELGIKDFRIHRPKSDAPVNYGVWIEFHKPAEQQPTRQ